MQKPLLAIAVVCVATVVNVRAQVDTATVVGTVQDSSSAIVPSANVTATELSTNVIGSRQITDLPLNGRDYTQLATLTAGVAKITEMAAASMARRQPRMETRAGVSR